MKIKIGPSSPKFRWWAKAAPAYYGATREQLPNDGKNALRLRRDIWGGFLKRGHYDLKSGEWLILAEENSATEYKGWTYIAYFEHGGQVYCFIPSAYLNITIRALPLPAEWLPGAGHVAMILRARLAVLSRSIDPAAHPYLFRPLG